MEHHQLKQIAAEVAEAMKSGELSPELRQKFIDIRAELFQRGIFDPVLARFDSATVPHASVPEVAEQLANVAAAL